MKLLFIILPIMVIFLFGCSGETNSPDITDEIQFRELTSDETKIVNSNKNFGLTLFKEINNSENENRNVFISPLSVSMALGMTLNGASSATYDAMQSTLQFTDMTNEEINTAYQTLIELLQTADENVLFEIANSIWYRNTFTVETEFIATNQQYFNAEINSADFNNLVTVDLINNWVSLKTHEKIKTIISSISPETVMYLINAIYFNGTWKYEFDKDATKDELFYLKDGSNVPVQMMNISAKFEYYEDDDIQIVDLPYGDSKFSMTVFLPKGDIQDFISFLTSENIATYLSQMETDSGSVFLPKLKLGYKIILNDLLANLGMGIAFGGGADFTRINTNGGLLISKVLHKTFIQVDEKGTEAAAVTVVVIDLTSIDPDSPFTMNINRPYIFVIREKNSEAILFMGKIMQPEWED